MEEQRRLYRSRDEKMISGVCGGIAEYFGVDPTLVRVIAVLLLVVGNAATVIVYIVMAAVVPEAPGAQPDTTRPPDPAGPPAPPAPSTPHEPVHRARTSGSVTAGLILIAIGALMLVARFEPQFGLWNAWPLIIVIVGLIQALTPGKDGWGIERFFDGLVTVAFGLVFLAITFGYVGWGVWWRVLSLWPALLVAIGLGILGGAVGQSWIKAMGSLVIIAALAFAVVSGPLGTPLFSSTGGEEFSFSESSGSESEAALAVKAGAGEISIAEGEEGLVAVDGVSPFSRPSFEVSREASSANVEFNMGETDGVVIWPGSSGAAVDARLSPDVVWTAEVDSGVCTVDADLSDLQVRSLVFSTGMSDAKLRLGDVAHDVGEATVLVKAGMSSVTLEVPDDAPIRIEADTGLSSLDVADLENVGGRVWKSAGYDEARAAGDDVWNVRIEAGLGSVRVRTY